jgi:hypothetical protein
MRSPIQTINLYSTLPATRLRASQLICGGRGGGFATVSSQYRGGGRGRGFATVSLECGGFATVSLGLKPIKTLKLRASLIDRRTLYN